MKTPTAATRLGIFAGFALVGSPLLGVAAYLLSSKRAYEAIYTKKEDEKSEQTTKQPS
jgi:hypothetical protein